VEIALAFRASEILMRLNAPNAVLAAIAIVLSLPAGAHAAFSRANKHTKKQVTSSSKVSVTRRSRAGAPARTTATSEDFVKAAHPLSKEAKSPEIARPISSRYSKGTARRVVRNLPSSRRQTQQQVSPAIVRTITDDDNQIIVPLLYNRRGRLIVPPPMKGSHEILVRQNLVADREGLDRIKDDEDIEFLRSEGLLVAIPQNQALDIDERLPMNRRYCRPWTSQFLAALARAHYARFHTPLQVNSAVRTVEFQQRLLRTNGNAAPAEGETASPHLTGQAIDLAKHGLSMTEIAWLRGYLMPLVQQGKIDVEEEFQQSCFHISVYKRYMPSEPLLHQVGHHSPATALAAALP
jgi:hypothetical protein